MFLKYISVTNSKINKIEGLALLFKAQRVENTAYLEKISGQMYLIVDEGYKRLYESNNSRFKKYYR